MKLTAFLLTVVLSLFLCLSCHRGESSGEMSTDSLINNPPPIDTAEMLVIDSCEKEQRPDTTKPIPLIE